MARTIQTASKRTTPDAWKKRAEKESNDKANCQQELDKRNIMFEKKWSSYTLETLIKRSDYGLLALTNCTREELMQFCYQRAADMTHGISDPDLYSKDDFVMMLKAADQEFEFHRFIDLPPELRNLIFDFALVHHENGDLANIHPVKKASYKRALGTLALTQVSSDLRKETLPIYYSVNTFALMPTASHEYKVAEEWLKLIGPGAVRHIRHILRNAMPFYDIDAHEVTLAIKLSGSKTEVRQDSVCKACAEKAMTAVRMIEIAERKIKRKGGKPRVTALGIMGLLEDDREDSEEDDDEDDEEDNEEESDEDDGDNDDEED